MDDTVVHRVSCGLFVRPGQVLLVHRSPSKEWYPNVWDLPGGHVESGETFVQALTREMYEELKVQITPPIGRALLTVREVDLVLKLWVIDSWEGTIVNAAPEEHDDIGWFTSDEAKRLDLADANYRNLFDKVIG